MADSPGRSYRSNHNVSRHTVVMRRAKDEDARRVAERDDGDVVHEDSRNPSARLTARGAGTRRLERPKSERSISGRQVTVEHAGSVSRRYTTRLSGERADAIPVAGGDTIIKYKSGDMVIVRGSRRARVRRQIISVYALGYLILFGLFVYHMLTGTMTVTPQAFLDKAFKMRQGSDIMDLERAAYEAMRGNRTPAEIRMAQQLNFYDEEKDNIHVASGDRLTLLTAAKLGHAIIEDQKKSPNERTFQEPFKVYKETHLSGINWPHLLTLYNAIGFFLLVLLFLYRPIMHYLGTQGKKTAVALRNARDSQQEAADYRDRYRELAGAIEQRRDELQSGVAERSQKEREQALADARGQAAEISGGIKGALRMEKTKQYAAIGTEAANEACERAREILEKDLGQAEHDAAIDELIADIASGANSCPV